tara:strand:+ start:1750 stop:2550 length:801 start_codon:yes stop_codon:yes gene_type:complete
MGIINLTPDSFYDGGKYISIENAINKVREMVDEKVDIIDLGAASSRPGSKFISLKEEEKRLFPSLIKIRELFPNITISIDTYRYQIAEQAIKYGANMINDIYVEKDEDKMFKVIKKYNTPYVLMHMHGTPINMQKNIQYNFFKEDIVNFFKRKIEKIRLHGFDKVIIDPGFGFGKTLNQNYQLINMIPELQKFQYPILVGVSRKSMISQGLHTKTIDSLNGTVAANTICLMNGANIIRVHDVKAGQETIEIFKLVQRNSIYIKSKI